MSDFGSPGETAGYPYPSAFQKPLANPGKSVIKKPKAKKPIVKKRKQK